MYGLILLSPAICFATAIYLWTQAKPDTPEHSHTLEVSHATSVLFVVLGMLIIWGLVRRTKGRD